MSEKYITPEVGQKWKKKGHKMSPRTITQTKVGSWSGETSVKLKGLLYWIDADILNRDWALSVEQKPVDRRRNEDGGIWMNTHKSDNAYIVNARSLPAGGIADFATEYWESLEVVSDQEWGAIKTIEQANNGEPTIELTKSEFTTLAVWANAGVLYKGGPELRAEIDRIRARISEFDD